MAYGKAQGLKVKTFSDYSDGTVEEKINKFFNENSWITVMDIKYFNGYGVVNSNECESYGRETAIIIYRDDIKFDSDIDLKDEPYMEW